MEMYDLISIDQLVIGDRFYFPKTSKSSRPAVMEVLEVLTENKVWKGIDVKNTKTRKDTVVRQNKPVIYLRNVSAD